MTPHSLMTTAIDSVNKTSAAVAVGAAARRSGRAAAPMIRLDLLIERQMFTQEEPARGDTIGFEDYLKVLPRMPFASSYRLGWADVDANRCCATPPFELNLPALSYHRFVLYTRPPEG